jgi:hypothetical protein
MHSQDERTLQVRAIPNAVGGVLHVPQRRQNRLPDRERGNRAIRQRPETAELRRSAQLSKWLHTGAEGAAPAWAKRGLILA